MPFLLLPGECALSDAQHDALGKRLCPYDETPRKIQELGGYTVWGTSLVRSLQGRTTNALVAGTAGFELRQEGEALVVSTDPLGTCPIWYARLGPGWIVSPEAKAIAAVSPVALRATNELLAPGSRAPDWSPFPDVARLAAGARLRLTGERAVSEGRPFDLRLNPVGGELGEAARKLGEVLQTSFEASGATTAAFVSGGIDSSIACALARRGGPVRTLSLGTEYGDEFAGARALAESLDCRHEELHLDHEGVRREFDRVVFTNEVFDGLTAEILTQLSFLYGAAQVDSRRIVTGYGSDLLFDGMLRHRLYMQAVGLSSTPELIARTRWTGELAPFVHWSRGQAAEHVFWNPAVIALALSLPRDLCLVDGVEKYVLREAAVRTGLLPAELAFRPKTGMTDGTGANRLLSEALGLEDSHAYREKSLLCIERFRALLGS